MYAYIYIYIYICLLAVLRPASASFRWLALALAHIDLSPLGGSWLRSICNCLDSYSSSQAFARLPGGLVPRRGDSGD